MRAVAIVVLTAGLLAVGGCADDSGPTAKRASGVNGVVQLGPQCPVESRTDPCVDQPAADVIVTVSKQLPGDAYVAGDVVARTTTGADGTFRVPVPPGAYVVTADAGMSCELMDARVTDERYARVAIPCDTGIR